MRAVISKVLTGSMIAGARTELQGGLQQGLRDNVSFDCVRCWREARDRGVVDIFSRRMQLCPTCGNKRCPKASDHRNVCTGSNAPGQTGSIYA